MQIQIQMQMQSHIQIQIEIQIHIQLFQSCIEVCNKLENSTKRQI